MGLGFRLGLPRLAPFGWDGVFSFEINPVLFGYVKGMYDNCNVEGEVEGWIAQPSQTQDKVRG